MRRRRIVFWLGEPSPHQGGYLAALADLLPANRIIAVFERRLQTERLAQGWSAPDLERIEVVQSPDPAAVEEIASSEPGNTVHVFGGFRLRIVHRALPICARTGALIGMTSEARNWRGALGGLRLLHSHFVERPYRNRIDFVLAIGHRAVRWYELCGYAPAKIFRWAYVVERPASGDRARGTVRTRDVVISYVGRIIKGKGIDTLLAALPLAQVPGWRLQIVGDGQQRPLLEALTRTLGLDERVHFLGVKSNAEVWKVLEATDLLVFPSRIDGWGAVVNEALMSGTPVLCSDYCGAADLVRENDFGEVFRTGSVASLAAALTRWIAKGSLPATRRSAIRDWSKCIEGEAAARYLIEVIEHVDEGAERPVAPWFRHRSTADGPPGDDGAATRPDVRTCG